MQGQSAHWQVGVIFGAIVVGSAAISCGPSCVDDGLHVRQDCPAGATSGTGGTTSGSVASTTYSETATSTRTTTSTQTSTAAASTETGEHASTTSGTTGPLDSTSGESDSASEGSTAGPTCSDGQQNGGESDIDCGGECSPCKDGQRCEDSGDCESTACHYVGVCVVPACADGIYDFAEVYLDCGGLACGKTCGLGAPCGSMSDCFMGDCFPPGKCALDPSCNDGLENGSETDLDCGGACGPTCRMGQVCAAGGDCTSGSCTANLCDDPPSCSDGLRGGAETDVDCSGPCRLCEQFEACVFHGDCVATLVCSGFQCNMP